MQLDIQVSRGKTITVRRRHTIVPRRSLRQRSSTPELPSGQRVIEDGVLALLISITGLAVLVLIGPPLAILLGYIFGGV